MDSEERERLLTEASYWNNQAQQFARIGASVLCSQCLNYYLRRIQQINRLDLQT
jgi:hypothetical protein